MLTTATKEVQSIQSNCQSLATGDPLDALTEQQVVEEEVKKLHKRIHTLSLQPLINPWMRAKSDGSNEETLSMLMDNFKLTYDTDASSGDREGEGPDNQSVDNSDSSVDSFMDGNEELLEAYHFQNLERRVFNDETKRNQVYSQETQNTVSNFTPLESAVRLDVSDHPTGHNLNWVSSVNPPSSSMSLFNQSIRGRVNMTQLLDDSESNSDADNLFQQYHRSLNSGRGVDLSTDDSDHESLNGSHQHQSLDLGSSAVGGMESILDSLEIRRHWNFLNSSGISENVETGTGESSKEDEDDMCRFIGMLCLHPLFLIILLSFAQVWSLWLSIMKFVLPTQIPPPLHPHTDIVTTLLILLSLITSVSLWMQDTTPTMR